MTWMYGQDKLFENMFQRSNVPAGRIEESEINYSVKHHLHGYKKECFLF